MKKITLIIASFTIVFSIYRDTNIKTEHKTILTDIETFNPIIEQLKTIENAIYTEENFTNFIYEDSQFKNNLNFTRIKEKLEEKKGIIKVTKTLDFLFDSAYNINYVFIPLNQKTELELKQHDENYQLRIRTPEPFDYVISGDQEFVLPYYQLQELIHTIDLNYYGDYYHQLFNLSNDTLEAQSDFSYIAYNMSLEDIKIVNNLEDININNELLWKKKEALSLAKLRAAFKKN